MSTEPTRKQTRRRKAIVDVSSPNAPVPSRRRSSSMAGANKTAQPRLSLLGHGSTSRRRTTDRLTPNPGVSSARSHSRGESKKRLPSDDGVAPARSTSDGEASPYEEPRPPLPPVRSASGRRTKGPAHPTDSVSDAPSQSGERAIMTANSRPDLPPAATDQSGNDTHAPLVGGSSCEKPGGLADAGAHVIRAYGLSHSIINLANLHRSRLHFVSAKVAIQLQIKAIQRRVHAQTCPGGKLGKDGVRYHSTCSDVYEIETPDTQLLTVLVLKPLEEQAKLKLNAMLLWLPGLPEQVVKFAEETRGFGLPSLAQIIAESGDLSRYANPAKLWKRMGVGLGPAGEVFYEGRSPRRRSLMYVIGANFVRSSGPYRDLYDQRKAYEQTKPACGKALKTGGICKAKDAECCRAGHIHNRSMRWVTKRLLRDLWRVWRNA